MPDLNRKKGFTIIEVIVVIAVFLMVIGAGLAIFVSIIQSQKNILSRQQALSQASYGLERMSKALRVARKSMGSESDSDCLEPGFFYLLTRKDADGFFRGVKFINPSDNDACTEFYLDGSGALKELKDSANDEDAIDLISGNMKIKYLRFGINGMTGKSSDCALNGYENDLLCGASSQDLFQPKITTLLGIESGADILTLQTTVSQRNLNSK